MRTGFWFVLVGSCAAFTHMAVFAGVAPFMWPELANAAGFVVAFFVSFAGHRWLSFQDADTGLWQSLRRFAVTAIAGFVANELMFVLLLRGLEVSSWVALFLALVFASAQTFLLSRFWAFRRTSH